MLVRAQKYGGSFQNRRRASSSACLSVHQENDRGFADAVLFAEIQGAAILFRHGAHRVQSNAQPLVPLRPDSRHAVSAGIVHRKQHAPGRRLAAGGEEPLSLLLTQTALHRVFQNIAEHDTQIAVGNARFRRKLEPDIHLHARPAETGKIIPRHGIYRIIAAQRSDGILRQVVGVVVEIRPQAVIILIVYIVGEDRQMMPQVMPGGTGILDILRQLLKPLGLQGELCSHFRLLADLVRHVHAGAQREVIGGKAGKSDKDEHNEHFPAGKQELHRQHRRIDHNDDEIKKRRDAQLPEAVIGVLMEYFAEGVFKKPEQKRIGGRHERQHDTGIQPLAAGCLGIDREAQLDKLSGNIEQRRIGLHHQKDIKQLGGGDRKIRLILYEIEDIEDAKKQRFKPPGVRDVIVNIRTAGSHNDRRRQNHNDDETFFHAQVREKRYAAEHVMRRVQQKQNGGVTPEFQRHCDLSLIFSKQ